MQEINPTETMQEAGIIQQVESPIEGVSMYQFSKPQNLGEMLKERLEQNRLQTDDIDYKKLAEETMKDLQQSRSECNNLAIQIASLQSRDAARDHLTKTVIEGLGLDKIVRKLIREELADHTEIDYDILASRLDYSDIVSEIDYGNLASELDIGDIAYYLDSAELARHISYSDLADEIDSSDIADELTNRIQVNVDFN